MKVHLAAAAQLTSSAPGGARPKPEASVRRSGSRAAKCLVLSRRTGWLSPPAWREACKRSYQSVAPELPGAQETRRNETRNIMLIRAGYQIGIQCDQETPLMALLSVHPSRAHTLRTPAVIKSTGPAPLEAHLDEFGNLRTQT